MKLAHWFWIWLCMSMLLGCMAAVPAFADELCSAAKATIEIADVTVGKEGTIDGKGTWTAEGAEGVLVEYRIDSDRMQSETRMGKSGSWDFARMQPKDPTCGRHTLVVFAFPSVKADKRQLHCLNKASSKPRVFEVSCTPLVEIADCQWECGGTDSPQCTGICTASARRGRLGYIPFWGVNGEGWEQGEAASEGPWHHSVVCDPGQKISFKVRDRDGRGYWSEVDEIGCGVTE
jgi:hypothetical protein